MAASKQASPAYVGLVQATAGAVGGLFASFVLMPLEVVKTRISVGQTQRSDMAGVAREIVASSGLQGLFAGVTPKCAETGAKNFIYFYIYDALNTLSKNRIGKAGTTGKLVLGYIAGVGTIVSTMPLEVLATKLQSVEASGKSLISVTRDVIEKEGVAGLFRGFWFNILLCINPAIQNTCFDYMKAVVLSLKRRAESKKRAALTASQAFVLGAIAKAIATGLTFPLVRVKTILQAAPASAGSAQNAAGDVHPAVVESSETSLKVERKQTPCLLVRLAQLYKGINSALWKSVLQAALLYMTKDQVETAVTRFFWICAKTMRRLDGSLKLGAFSGRPLPH